MAKQKQPRRKKAPLNQPAGPPVISLDCGVYGADFVNVQMTESHIALTFYEIIPNPNSDEKFPVRIPQALVKLPFNIGSQLPRLIMGQLSDLIDMGVLTEDQIDQIGAEMDRAKTEFMAKVGRTKK